MTRVFGHAQNAYACGHALVLNLKVGGFDHEGYKFQVMPINITPEGEVPCELKRFRSISQRFERLLNQRSYGVFGCI